MERVEQTPGKDAPDTGAVYERLSRQKGYKERASQRLMATAIAHGIAETLPSPRVIVAEGLTGDGKSLAYFLGAYPQARGGEETRHYDGDGRPAEPATRQGDSRD